MSYQSFHNHYLNLLKKHLGASYISWVEEKGNKSLKVKIGKKTRYFPFEGNNITQETYTKLLKDLYDGEKSQTAI